MHTSVQHQNSLGHHSTPSKESEEMGSVVSMVNGAIDGAVNYISVAITGTRTRAAADIIDGMQEYVKTKL